MATRKKTAVKKGRGAPGKPKSAAHKAAIAKALKAYHARGGKKKKKASKASIKARRNRVTSSARSKHVLKNLAKYKRNAAAGTRKKGRRATTRAKANNRARYYRNKATSKPRRAA